MKTCAHCQNEFVPNPKSKSIQIYCSKLCKNQGDIKKSAEKRMMAGRLCLYCKESFKPVYKNQRYCTHEHKLKAQWKREYDASKLRGELEDRVCNDWTRLARMWK